MAEQSPSPDPDVHPSTHTEDETHSHRSIPRNTVLVSRQSWIGPLPPPDVLSRYNVVENGAERLFRMVEKQSEHRMRLENAVIRSDNRVAMIGQWFGLIAVLAVLGLAGYMAYLGATWEAATVAGIDIVGLAAVFVYSRLSRRDPQENQAADTDDFIEIDADLR